MEYFYLATGNEVKGPVSEDVLKNLFFQRRLSLENSVALTGSEDWRSLKDCFPDLEFYRGCPKCFEKVTIQEASCPHCRFPIFQFDINAEHARRRPIEQAEVDWFKVQALIQAEVKSRNSAGAKGCAFIVLLVLAVVALFIPIIGIFAAVGCFVGAIASLFQGVSAKEIAEIKKRVIDRLSSPFVGACPKCSASIEDAQTYKGHSTCPHCLAPLQKDVGFIYYIPHAAALIGPPSGIFE